LFWPVIGPACFLAAFVGHTLLRNMKGSVQKKGEQNHLSARMSIYAQ
jgi:hypothetical protein